MIKINSELPLCMLSQNNKLNEYDFVLFHLYKTNETYREYFLNQRREHPDRLMIFDNSAYEFFVKGETLELNQYYNAICELNPDYYILPDTLMNYGKTMADSKTFLNIYGTLIRDDNRLISKPLAVIQGNCTNEFEIMLGFYKKLEIDAIAIPFHNSFLRDLDIDDDIYNTFMDEFGPDNIDAEYAMGRVQFMRDHKDYLKTNFKHIHLLGSHQPFEKQWYHEFDTMDTGYPVKCAIEGIRLGKDYKKPEIIIDNFINDDLSEGVRSLITYNIEAFKTL